MFVRLRSIWLPICAAVLAVFILGAISAPSPALAQGKKKLIVKVKFNGEGSKKWGKDAERADMIAKLKAQLQSEWGSDVKARLGWIALETVKGLDVDVSADDGTARDLTVVVHDMDDGDGGAGNFGSYTPGTNVAHIYPKNMKDKGWSTNLAQWIEKTASHEAGHYGCANEHNEGTTEVGGSKPDKMAQSGPLKKWADNQNPKILFDDANNGRKFSFELRRKQMRNLNRGGPQCKTEGDFFDSAIYGGSTLVVDDPTAEEGGIANFAITASGSLVGQYDLGMMNPGEDGIANTADDVFLTKWLGNKDMSFDWTPDDGVEDWVPCDDQQLDSVVSLFDTAWYTWAVSDIVTGECFTLGGNGTLTLTGAELNAQWNQEVYNTAGLSFDLNHDGVVDLNYTLSSDLSGITENGEQLYAPNKYGTGFRINPVPEPSSLLALAGGLGYLSSALWRRRR